MLIRKEGHGNWHPPKTDAYTDEGSLQKLIAESPWLLPGISEGPCVVATEVPVPDTGSADVVILDAEGKVTICECKLRANPEIRREVVGQALAYAAGLWGLSYDELQGRLARAKTFQELGEGWAEADVRPAVGACLERGAFRMIIAVDEITDELKRIVSYLNRHTGADVEFLAIELVRAADHGVEVLVPETYGEESAKDKARSSRRATDRTSLLAALAEADPGSADAAQALLDWGEKHPDLDINWSRSGDIAFANGKRLLRIWGEGTVEVRVQTLREVDPDWDDDERIEQLLQRLEDIDGIRLKGNRRQWPRAPLAPLADPRKREGFLGVLEDVVRGLEVES